MSESATPMEVLDVMLRHEMHAVFPNLLYKQAPFCQVY